jgi:hypothetical protein
MSRLSRIDAATFKGVAEFGQDAAQSAIDVEYAREPDGPRNLPYRALVLESKREQQAIGRIKLFDRSSECELELLSPDSGIGLVIRLTYEAVWLDFVGDEIFESSACPVLLLPILLFTTRASVTPAKVIEHESAGDDDKP